MHGEMHRVRAPDLVRVKIPPRWLRGTSKDYDRKLAIDIPHLWRGHDLCNPRCLVGPLLVTHVEIAGDIAKYGPIVRYSTNVFHTFNFSFWLLGSSHSLIRWNFLEASTLC